jgi:hypothetical protein
MKCRWNRTMLNLCGIVVAFIIYPHMKCRWNKIWYVGRLWCPELIPDIEKFLPIAIFKMAATIRKNSTLSDIINIWYLGKMYRADWCIDLNAFLCKMQWERYHLFYCHINTQMLKLIFFWWISSMFEEHV